MEQDAMKYRVRSNICKACEYIDCDKWRRDHPERYKKLLQRYRSTDEFREKINKYRRDKYHSSLIDRITTRCRQRVRDFVKNKSPGLHKELIGCSYEIFLEWLEFNFQEGMSWDNFGDKWHIDHVMPCAFFDMTDKQQQKQCFHWTNMQPLDKYENMSKGDKIVPYHVENCKKRVKLFLQEYPELQTV